MSEEIKLTRSELDSMLKNAEQDGRLNSIEESITRQWGDIRDIKHSVSNINDSLAKGYATIEHVDETVNNAVNNERLLIRVALWGMGVAFLIVMPVVSYLFLDKIKSLDEHMKRNEQTMMKIERHINDDRLHNDIRR